MTYRRRVAGATLSLLLVAASASAAPEDGFTAFWKQFVAALGKDDVAALAAMTQVGPDLDQNPVPRTFAQFHARRLTPRLRRCLAHDKPVRGVDGYGHVNYSAFCGELIFGFSHTAGGWKLTDTGAND